MVVVPRKVRSKDKIFTDLKGLAAVLRGLQTQGKVIVFTNGVFDLLHVGHVRCLEDARARGDYLVVGLNDDASAEAIKGKGRPITPIEERMEVIAALWFVDYVTAFGEPTAEQALRKLRPDFYAKGSDYNAKTLPERDVVRELEIKPLFVGDKKAHSTTRILQRIKKKKLA